MKLALKELYFHNNAELLQKCMNQAEIKDELEVKHGVSRIKENIGRIEDKYKNEIKCNIDQQFEVSLNVESNSIGQFGIHMDNVNPEYIQISQSDIRKQLSFPCNLCDRQFSKAQEYRKHKFGVHMEDEDDVWKNCEDLKEKLKKLEIKQEYNVEKNMPKHSKSKETSVCEYCEREIKYGHRNLPVHYALQHTEELIKNHPHILLEKPCPQCDLKFLGISDLNKHLHAIHRKP